MQDHLPLRNLGRGDDILLDLEGVWSGASSTLSSGVTHPFTKDPQIRRQVVTEFAIKRNGIGQKPHHPVLDQINIGW